MPLQHHIRARVDSRGDVRRRDFLKLAGAGGVGAGMLGWSDLMSLRADDLRRRGKACILLWMQGGPSQFETFSPKPDHANGGETKAISTSVAGIEYSENLPHLAKTAQHWAVLRSVTSREGSHPRATSLLHTGYLPMASVKHPTFGSICAKELPNDACELPAFVQVGGGRGFGMPGAGFLGVAYDPFNVPQGGAPPRNAQPGTSTDRFQQRLGLLGRLQEESAESGVRQLVADHQTLYGKASRMILSPQMKAFDLSQESPATRDDYGRGPFGAACLLARRLVETGVTFIEVTSNNWDTHDNNFERSRTLCEQIDRPMARLVEDLHNRGLLDDTLVVWMGEFGRTPRINPRGGRDHYPRAFTAALAGGGVRGGQIIGATDASGESVADRPVTVPDLFQSFCTSLGIDANKENMSAIGRPIKVVDGGEPVHELFA